MQRNKNLTKAVNKLYNEYYKSLKEEIIEYMRI
jgi:hypothetical protein